MNDPVMQAIAAQEMLQAKAEIERLRFVNAALLSIAKRWCALDAGAWHLDRHVMEKAELLKDTAAAIAKASAP